MADNLTSATIDVRANTRGMEKDILKALRTVEFSQVNTKKSSQALGRITGQVSEFNKSLEASNARVVAFGASAGAIFAVEKAFSSLISSTIEVEKKLTDINVILGLSSSGLEKFGDSLFSVAKNTAQSFSSVADAAIELSRQGLGVEETLKRTNAALILTRLSGLDAESSVKALTATLNSFAGSALDAVEVVNKLANVDAAFAVSSADLANAISRVGSTAVDAGVSLDELIALVTSAQQTTARGGAVIGNSFKTIFTRLQRGKVQDLLGSLGVDTSETQSAISLLQQLATTYDTLGATQRAYVAEQVGGVFQINILKAALSDLGKEYSIFGRALDTSLSSTDQAIRRNELLNQTVSALSTQAVANLEQAANKIGSIVFEPNAKSFLSGFNNILNSFNNIDAESAGGKLMTGFFKGIGDFISGPGAVLTTAVVVKLFATLSKFASGSIRELLGVNKAAQQQAGIEQSILSILQKNNQFTSQILSGKITTVQAEKELLNYLTAQSNILREQERLSKVIGANLAKAGISIGASGVPMAAAAAKGKKAASSGFVPNFASDQAIGQAMENVGAKEHGYKAGKARKTTIHDGNGKSFKSFINNKEDITTFTNAAGKKATIVRPPNGFGENTQYAAGGFIPNFAEVAEIAKLNSRVNERLLLSQSPKGDGRLNKKDLINLSGRSYIQKQFPIKSGEKFKDYENRVIKQSSSLLGKNYLSGDLLRFSTSAAVDGFSIQKNGNKTLIDLLEVKGGKNWNPTSVLNKFLRALPENYLSNNPLDVFTTQRDNINVGATLVTPYTKGKANPTQKKLLSKSSGFIPNFGSKMQELFKNIKMREGQDDPFEKRAQKANLAAKKGIPLKNLGKLDYTMIHASDGGKYDLPADYLKEDRKTKEKTQYTAKITTAGLDPKKIMGGSVENRVGDALVTEANNLAKTVNPSGGTQFSNYKQLSNTGSVFSAAGTVFESAVRQAFNVPAQGQADRIDFPNPSSQLRSFFGNATGPYEAKISNTAGHRSSALSKWVAINKLASGFVPNFAGSRSGGLSFVQKDKDEFGFSELQAIMGGKRVGSFSYAEDKPGRLDVGDFTVNKSERGRGIGSELYKEAIRRNAGKKMKGQLLPQMNRLLQKIKKGEPVSAETLYPQIKRADLAKSSVFEVHGHKGMTVEKMNRDQFASFVNAKITELKKDPKKLQSYFGNVEADEYGGLGVDLQTQHSSGFVPNFASPKLISEISKRIKNPNIAQKLQEGAGLKDAAYLKAASKLGVNVSGLDYLSPQMGFPLKGKDKVLKLSKALGFGFGRSFSIDALKMGDWNYVKSQFESAGLTQDDFVKLSKFANTSKGENALKWWKSPSLSKASGFVPNFAKGSGRTSNSFLSSKNTSRFVHPLNPKFSPQGAVSFPDLEKLKGSVKIIWREAMQGQDVLSLSQFKEMAALRASKPEWWKRNSFEYIYNSGGFVPNFASALNDAIAREKSAGLSSSQIYVDKHSSLKNKNNPMGLMVANTRDEPGGGIQGIKRAKKEGRNPKTYGAATGFVPNFAKQEDLDEIKSFSDALAKLTSEIANREAEISAAEARLKADQNNLAMNAFSQENADAIQALNVDNNKNEQAKKNNPALAGGLDTRIEENNKKIIAIKEKQEAETLREIESSKKLVESNKSLAAKLISERDEVEKNMAAKKKSMTFMGKAGNLAGKTKNFFKENALSVGFGLQAVAGSVGEIAGGDTTGGRIANATATGAGTIAGFAGTGAMFGPKGAAIGAAIGAIKALSDGIKMVNSKVPGLEKALETSSSSLNRFGESGQKILQLSEQYSEALTSGGDPSKAAEIMVKTQAAYAEELSKLTDAQRNSMISAIAQGKGQEAYAKILQELQEKVKADEVSASFGKFAEEDSETLRTLTGGFLGQGNKDLLKGLESTFATQFTKGLDIEELERKISVYRYSPEMEKTESGSEQSALSLLKGLASSDKFNEDQKGQLNDFINAFQSASSETNLKEFSDKLLKLLSGRPEVIKQADKATAAEKQAAEDRLKKQQEEIAAREAANARLLKIQADTEAVYRKFNDGLDQLISSMQVASQMREAAGSFKFDYIKESGANSNISDVQNEKNILQKSSDDLTLSQVKNQKDTFNNFNSAIDEMLSGITADSAKRKLLQTATDQGNQVDDIKASLQAALAPVAMKIFDGQYGEAASSAEKIITELPKESKEQIGETLLVKGITSLKTVAEQGNRNQQSLINDSRRDLAIQAQQLVFQKAMTKLSQAQNFGGASTKDIITNEPNTPANRALEAINNLKILGYSQSKLRQGEVRGGTKETWGIDGKKPSAAMSGEVIDFYKAMSEVTGQSVISTESKDFKALVQASSEKQRADLDKIAKASGGVVDPMISTRVESNLQTLGGGDNVAKMKLMKELGYANFSGQDILKEAMKGFTGGAFEGLDPALKKAFENTSDEGAGANLLLLAGQQKQTDILGASLDLVTQNGLDTNTLLANQPKAIADAIGAILAKGKKEGEIANANQNISGLDAEISSAAASKKTSEQAFGDAAVDFEIANLKVSKWEGLSSKNNRKMLEEDSPEMIKAREITQSSKEDYASKGFGGQKAVLANEWQNAKNMVDASEEFKKLKSAESKKIQAGAEITSSSNKIREAEQKRDKERESLGTLTGELAQIKPIDPVSYDFSSVANGLNDVRAARKGLFGKDLAIEDKDLQAERQKEAVKKSSSDYKIMSQDGVKRTVEKDAMYQAGVSTVNQKNLDPETRMKRLSEAFRSIDGQNTLPSFENFEDVYAELGGGKEYARKEYEEKKASKFGIQNAPVLPQKPASSAPAPQKKKQEQARKTETQKTVEVAQSDNLEKTKDNIISDVPNKLKQIFVNTSAIDEEDKKIRAEDWDRMEKGEKPSREYKMTSNAVPGTMQDKWDSKQKENLLPFDIEKFKKIRQPEALQLATYEGMSGTKLRRSDRAPKEGSPLGEIAWDDTKIPTGRPKAPEDIRKDWENNKAGWIEKNISPSLKSPTSATPSTPSATAAPVSFIDWAKKEGKVSKDFELTKGMRVGEEALPENVKKAREEYLGKFGAKTKYGATSSTVKSKDQLAASVKQIENEELARKEIAEKEANVELMKPKLTGTKTVPDGKGGFKQVAAPKGPKEALQQAEYETAKRNILFNKRDAAGNQSVPIGTAASETGQKAATAINEGVKKASEEDKKETSQEVKKLEEDKQTDRKLVETMGPNMTRKFEESKESPEQDPSQQILNSILASVQQIATDLQNKAASGETPASSTGAQGATINQNAGSNEISVNNQVSLTVNSGNGQGDVATTIAEQIKVGLSSFLSSPEFIGKVTSIANQAAGKITPPTVPVK